MTARQGLWTPDLADDSLDPQVSETAIVTVSQTPETPETPAVFRGSPVTSANSPGEAAGGGVDGSFGSFIAARWGTFGHRTRHPRYQP
ncbi:hypothetical protein ThrDRAFT_04538 [Frankia casuarinae]|nr:hypothetical protein ThrDRAFT_04538 [Frankia casuarinae]